MPTYKIILLGAAPGVSDIQAQAGFAKIFKLTPEQAAPMFAKTGRVLKSGLTSEQATAYIGKLAAVGVACEMREESPQQAEPVASPAAESTAAANTEQPTAEQSAVASKPRPVAFVFNGNGFEYFKIWIVNILLSIVTLGIYSAWAKVRNKQYFYGNTYLDDVSFSYTANPVKILIGRIIALVFLIVYSVSGQLSIIASGVMGILLMVFMPWVICKSLRFNARYSSYRNVPFAFNGKVWGAACAFIFWPMLGFLVVGLLAAPGWIFFDTIQMIFILPILMVVVLFGLFPLVFCKQKHFIYGNHSFGTSPFRFSATAGSYYLAFLLGIGMLALFAGVGFLLATTVNPALFQLVFVPGYLVVLAFAMVRIANINYNAITLNDHALRANWKLGPYLWLMVSNTLLIVLTLGLFIPWAKVRTARFKAEYTSAVFVGDMDAMAADEQVKVNALGESVGDLFDIEIGF